MIPIQEKTLVMIYLKVFKVVGTYQGKPTANVVAVEIPAGVSFDDALIQLEREASLCYAVPSDFKIYPPATQEISNTPAMDLVRKYAVAA